MTITPEHRKKLLDLSDWPRSWAREESDKEVVQRIFKELQPILERLLDEGLAINTLRRHRNSLYLLGDKVLGAFTRFPEDAPANVEAALEDLLNEEGGPELTYLGATEEDQRSFDATCRKVYRLLFAPGNRPLPAT